MAELSATTKIRTDNVNGAHQAMVEAANVAGYTVQEQRQVPSRGHYGRPATFDRLYRLGGNGPQDGGFLRLFRPNGAPFYRLQVSQEVRLHENQLGEAQATIERFLRNVEDAVNSAVRMADGPRMTPPEPNAGPVPSTTPRIVPEATLG